MHNDLIRGVTPQKAQQALKEGKIEVTIQQAEEILDFLYMLAEIALDTYVFPNEKLNLSPSEFSRDKAGLDTKCG